MYIASGKAGRTVPSKPFETEAIKTRCGAIGFRVSPAGFQTCFGTVFLHSAPITTILEWNVYSENYMLRVCNLFSVSWGRGHS